MIDVASEMVWQEEGAMNRGVLVFFWLLLTLVVTGTVCVGVFLGWLHWGVFLLPVVMGVLGGVIDGLMGTDFGFPRKR